MIATLSQRRYRLPLRQTIRSGHGEFRERSGTLLKVVLSDGSTGLGEVATWPGFGSSDTQCQMALDDIMTGARILPNVAATLEGLRQIEAIFADAPEVAFGLSAAIANAWAHRQDVPTRQFLCDTPRDALPLSRLCGSAEDAMRAASDGADCLKFKLALSTTTQVCEWVSAVRTGGYKGIIRGDANTSLPPDRVRLAAWARQLAHAGFDEVEQPTRPGTESQWHVVRAQGLLVYADESVTDTATARRLITEQVCDGLILKPMYCGGVAASLEIAALAGEAGLKIGFTHALDGVVSRRTVEHIAAAAQAELLHCGLGVALAYECDELDVADTSTFGIGVSMKTPRAWLAPPSAQALPHPLASAALSRPDHIAVQASPAASLSYSTLLSRALACATALHLAGVGAGQTVAFVAHKSNSELGIQTLTTLHAIGLLRCCAAPLTPGATTDERAAELLAHLPDHVLGEPLHVSCGTGFENMPTTAIFGEGCEADVLQPLAGMSHLHDPAWELRDDVLSVLTSGSTGCPKAVRLTAGQLVFGAFGSAQRLGHLSTDRWIHCLPLQHVGGLAIAYRAAWMATTVELQSGFDPIAVNAAIDEGASHVSLVPIMLSRLLDARGDRRFPSTLRAVLVGGAPSTVELIERARSLGAPVSVTWGMTEAASQVATAYPGQLPAQPGDVGAPLNVARVTAENGVLAISGPLVRHTLRTADRGCIDHGVIQVQGRVDDTIISGGKNIDPREIERTLALHPSVDQVVVVSVSDGEWGQRPIAVVACRTAIPERSTLESELRTHCKNHLSSFKTPDRVHIVDEIPRTALGKPAMTKLRAIALGGSRTNEVSS